ncbi:MAG: hypothetical protein ACRDMX_04450, partial [Solirubrobacteraceae bacterium]
MCGIAGIIYKNGNGAHRIGRDMTSMLQSMKHRGPDSTAPRDLEFADNIRRRRRDVLARMKAAGATVKETEDVNEYT